MDFITAFTKDQIQQALASAPKPYNLGTPQAAALSIVNNSQYPVEIRSGSNLVNVVQPNSEMTLNSVPEVSLSLVTSAPGIYIPPDPIVTVTYLTTAQGYSQNALAPQTATVISGNVTADISGPVSAEIVGSPTVNLAADTHVNATLTGTNTINLATGTTVNATITNASIPVTGSVNATIQNSSIPVTLSGTNTVQANIVNSTLPVTLSGTNNVTATINGTPTVNLAAGTSVNVTTGSVNIANTPGVNVQDVPSNSGEGYALKYVFNSGNLNAAQYLGFLPNGTTTQVEGFLLHGNGFPANTSVTIGVTFGAKVADGSSYPDWLNSMIFQTFMADANGKLSQVYIDAPSTYVTGMPLLANQVIIQSNHSGNVYITLAGEPKRVAASEVFTWLSAVNFATDGSWINTNLSAAGLTSINGYVTCNNGGSSGNYGVFGLGLGTNVFYQGILLIPSGNMRGSAYFSVNLPEPLDYYAAKGKTLNFYLNFTNGGNSRASINATYNVFPGQPRG